MRAWLLLLLSLGLASAPVSGAATAGGKGRVFLTREEALALAFPRCEIERKRLVLTKQEQARSSKLAGKDVEVESRMVFAYEGRRDGKLVGTAYFDAHKVRTLDEVLMMVVDDEERLRRVEMLSFSEPEEYIPRGPWYQQFVGKKLSDDLRLKGDIKGVTGATLTANATSRAARRVLAVHGVLGDRK